MVHTQGPASAPRCSRCGSTHVDIVQDSVMICLDCGDEHQTASVK